MIDPLQYVDRTVPRLALVGKERSILQDVLRAGQSGAEGVEERGSWAVCEASLGAKPGSNGILDHHRHALCPLASTI